MNYSSHLGLRLENRISGSRSGNVFFVFEISVYCDTEIINFTLSLKCTEVLSQKIIHLSGKYVHTGLSISQL